MLFPILLFPQKSFLLHQLGFIFLGFFFRFFPTRELPRPKKAKKKFCFFEKKVRFFFFPQIGGVTPRECGLRVPFFAGSDWPTPRAAAGQLFAPLVSPRERKMRKIGNDQSKARNKKNCSEQARCAIVHVEFQPVRITYGS